MYHNVVFKFLRLHFRISILFFNMVSKQVRSIAWINRLYSKRKKRKKKEGSPAVSKRLKLYPAVSSYNRRCCSSLTKWWHSKIRWKQRHDGNDSVCLGLALAVRRLGEASTAPVVGKGDGNDSWTEPWSHEVWCFQRNLIAKKGADGEKKRGLRDEGQENRGDRLRPQPPSK